MEADGWFALETGPWLASSGAQQSKQIDHTGTTGATGATYATPGQGTHHTISSTAAALPDGVAKRGCLNGFVVPTEAEAFNRARVVFDALMFANPTATWVYQGYPWFRVYSQGKAIIIIFYFLLQLLSPAPPHHPILRETIHTTSRGNI